MCGRLVGRLAMMDVAGSVNDFVSITGGDFPAIIRQGSVFLNSHHNGAGRFGEPLRSVEATRVVVGSGVF